MASPFRVFRKHQKALLVVAGVILMFVFVLGDSIMSIIRATSRSNGQSGGSNSPTFVAVTWDGGKLTNRELYSLVARRQMVATLLDAIYRFGAEQYFPNQPPPPRVEPVAQIRTPEQGVERDVLRTLLLANLAKQAGMIVSDDDVRDYLLEIGLGRVSPDQIRGIIDQMGSHQYRVSVAHVVDAVRQELLARNYLVSYVYAFETVMPEQRWRDWLSVNDRVIIEAAPLSVESFEAEVPEPTESELVAFYDEHKERAPSPVMEGGIEMPSPLPGFAIPRKVKLVYVKADFDKFVEQLQSKVTEEEIVDYYEKNKDPAFVKFESNLFEDETSDGSGESSDDTSDESGLFDLSTEAEQPSAEDESPEDPDATVEVESTEEEEEEDETPDEAADATSFDTETAESATDESTAEDSSGEATSDTTAGEPAEEKPKEFEPLDNVRDLIRRQIAQRKVHEQLSDTMSKLKGDLKTAYTRYVGALLSAKAADKPLPPPPPELAELPEKAKELGLEYGQTEELASWKLADSPELGQLYDTERSSTQQAIPLIYTIFSDDLELYDPLETFDFNNNRFLVIKTSDTPRKVPEFDEVRDEVLQAWKLQEAAPLALKEAEELARQIQANGLTLGEYFASDDKIHVVQTDPFSWLTTGNVSRTGQTESFRLSKPEGIEGAGHEFMREVFELEDGQIGAVLNFDRSIAYLVRVVSHLDTQEQLRKYFLNEANSWNGLMASRRGHVRQTASFVLSDLYASENVDWKRPPDELVRGE